MSIKTEMRVMAPDRPYATGDYSGTDFTYTAHFIKSSRQAACHVGPRIQLIAIDESTGDDKVIRDITIRFSSNGTVIVDDAENAKVVEPEFLRADNKEDSK